MQTIDIVALIDKHPITKLSKNYNDKLINIIKEKFTDTQQHLFVASFYCYLNYDTKNDFVIDINDIWKWLGFSRKDNCKNVLEKYFIKDKDYKVYQNVAPEAAGATLEKLHGGHNKEKILMTINTFKKLCLKANTEKADEIHEYYIILEEIIHILLQEQVQDLTKQLTFNEEKSKKQEEELKLKEKLIEEKDRTINSLKKEDNYIYIAHNPAMANFYKIGRSKDPIVRLNAHKTSNPGIDYMKTYQTDEYTFSIEEFIKLFMKPFKAAKSPEWFKCNYNQIETITEFVIMMHKEYNILKSPETLMNFVNRYKANKLTQKQVVPQGNIIFDKDVYQQFIDDHFVYNEDYRIPMVLILEEFYNWAKENKLAYEYLKSPQGNWSCRFLKEFQSNIEDITGITKRYIDLIDKSRNYNYSNYMGFRGFELKSMASKNDTIYFNKEIYQMYINERLEITSNKKNKLTRNEVINDFIIWTKQNNYISKVDYYTNNNNFCNSFNLEIQTNFINNGLTHKDHMTNGIYKNMTGFINIKFKN